MKLLILNLILFPVFVMAGVTNGGGGSAIVCRDDKKKIVSAELLDLYEGKIQYALQMPQAMGDFATELQRAQEKFDYLNKNPRLESYLNPPFQWFYEKFKFLPKGVQLKPIPDSLEVLIPENCQIEQLAFFKETNVILVNADIWEKLSVLDRVGLVVHESVYNAHRAGGATDSREARKTTSHLLSTEVLDPVLSLIPESGVVYFCQTPDLRTKFFWIDQTGINPDIFSFVKIDGIPMLSDYHVGMGGQGRIMVGTQPIGGSTSIVSAPAESRIQHSVYKGTGIELTGSKSQPGLMTAEILLIPFDGDSIGKNVRLPLECWFEDRTGTATQGGQIKVINPTQE